MFVQDMLAIETLSQELTILTLESKKKLQRKSFEALMRIEGVEPPRREAPDPKSGVSTNSTISAVERQIYERFLKKKGVLLNYLTPHSPTRNCSYRPSLLQILCAYQEVEHASCLWAVLRAAPDRVNYRVPPLP